VRFYFVVGMDGGMPYTATLDEAKKKARETAAETSHDIEVEQVEVETTKENILRLLNVDMGVHTSNGVVYTAKAKKA
jgi:hypothetical protein